MVQEEFKVEIQDFGQKYILPGLVDLNVCVHLNLHSSSIHNEIYEHITKLALKGGTTFILDHPSMLKNLYDYTRVEARVHQVQAQRLFCDVGLLAYAYPNQNLTDFEHQNFLGYKIALTPQQHSLPHFTLDELSKAFHLTKDQNKPLFIIPELADQRYLNMTSPFRLLNVEERENPMERTPENIAGSFNVGFSDFSQSSSDELEMDIIETHANLQKTHFQDLKDRAKEGSASIKLQVESELDSYSESGATVFQKDCNVPQQSPLKIIVNPIKIESEEEQIGRLQKFRPKFSLQTNRPSSPTSPNSAQYAANYPQGWEIQLVRSVLEQLKNFDCAKVHVPNLSSPLAILECREHNVDYPFNKISTETTLPHLLLNQSMIKSDDTRFKLKPPIREKDIQELLTEITISGYIDSISSFHNEIPTKYKFQHNFDYQSAVSGFPTLGYSLCAAFTQIQGDPKSTLPLISRLMSSQPAEILGVDQIGSIQKGKEANFVIFDPEGVSICEDDSYLYSGLCPFISRKFNGRVIEVWIRGEVAYREGADFEQLGKFVTS